MSASRLEVRERGVWEGGAVLLRQGDARGQGGGRAVGGVCAGERQVCVWRHPDQSHLGAHVYYLYGGCQVREVWWWSLKV